MKRKFPAIALSIFLLLSGWAKSSAFSDERKPAPEFSLTGISGENFNLKDLKGKVIILDFFATWCPPCREEFPHFNNLYAEYKDKGLVMLGVCSDAIDTEKAKSLGIEYPVARQTPEIAAAYGPIRYIPTTFVIDKAGRIYKKYIGYQPQETFRQDVIQLLQED
jgi:peroxiredoxin